MIKFDNSEFKNNNYLTIINNINFFHNYYIIYFIIYLYILYIIL